MQKQMCFTELCVKRRFRCASRERTWWEEEWVENSPQKLYLYSNLWLRILTISEMAKIHCYCQTTLCHSVYLHFTYDNLCIKHIREKKVIFFLSQPQLVLNLFLFLNKYQSQSSYKMKRVCSEGKRLLPN